jgi:hypothetical protein
MNRIMRNRTAAEWLVTSGAIGVALFATAARAEVVVFDNTDGTFDWRLGTIDIDGTFYPGTFLDITKSAAEQTGERRAGTIGQWYRPNNASDAPAIRSLIGEDGVRTAKTTDTVRITWNDQFFFVKPTRDYAPGESVSVSDNWKLESTYFWHLPFSISLKVGSPAIGNPAYVGVRVKMPDDQWRYGWILFSEYQFPMAWAYETEPNTPIQIPVPAPAGAAMCLATGVMMSLRRQRSQGDTR